VYLLGVLYMLSKYVDIMSRKFPRTSLVGDSTKNPGIVPRYWI